MIREWPFAEPPDETVVTLKSILTEGKPVLYVYRDDDDFGWQFLDGGKVRTEDAVLATLRFMLTRDPSLAELADLPPGGQARRASVDAPWFRKVPTSK